MLNEDDALYWLGLLRRVLAGGVLLMLMMSLFVAAAQLDQLRPDDLTALLIEMTLVAIVFPLEHTQSALSACLLAVLVGGRLSSAVDRASVAIASFMLLQVLSYVLAVAAVVAFGLSSLSLALALFLFMREMLILVLWRANLRAANEDIAPFRSPLWEDSFRRTA